MRRLTIFTAAALAAASIGCSTATNTNVSVNKAGNANANSNVAVVVPNNSNAAANTGVMNGNSMTTTNYNVSRADYDRDRARYEADRGTSTIGQGADDSWIWFKTKGALATVDDLRDSTINVDVNNGVITLRGTVGSAAEKTAAVNAAKGIERQKGVKDELKVQAGDSLTNQATGANAGATTNANANRR